MLAATGVLVGPFSAESAHALSGSEFEAGNIISDELFFDSAAMSESEIQGFLSSQIGTCLNASCLNVLTVAASSRPAEVSSTTGALVCSAFQGGTLTAAAIIYRAQVACGISAKVILVMLQKEQSLVSATSPSTSRLDRAMGMACPDTAPCAEYALGFANQVYEGTKQLKVYSAGRFARQPGVHSIAYNPNSACGSAVVTIQNYATAALYNYTPYQPNAAALANLGGVGDACSSYGNRNFWLYYTNWFGSTTGNVITATNSAPQLLTRRNDGTLWIYQGNGRGGWRVPMQIGTGWQGFDVVFGAGDVNGDGNRDVLARDAAGALWLYPTDGKTGWLTTVKISDGWGAYTAIFAAGDFNGDGTQDIFTRDASGLLFLHANLGRARFAAPVQVGNGWQSMTAIFGAGDFSGDGAADVIARTPAGDLWLYRGNGRGSWLAASRIGVGWNGFSNLSGSLDFNGDGAQDVLARDGSGALWLYPGNGAGSWGVPSRVGVGWGVMDIIASSGPPAGRPFSEQAGVGDFTGDGARDILAMNSAGTLFAYSDGRPITVSGAWALGDLAVPIGDFDGNGSRDFLTRDSTGAAWLYSARGNGQFAGPPVAVGTGWEAFDLLIPTGDATGDGFADVAARDSAGMLWLYPGDGRGGWLPRRLAGNGWSSMLSVFSPGDFTGDGKPDLIARQNNGVLWLYSGAGSGTWAEPIQIGTGWAQMTALFGPGDMNGDGNPDVLARHSSGALLLYTGNGGGGWRGQSQIGQGWNVMSWIG